MGLYLVFRKLPKKDEREDGFRLNILSGECTIR